MKPKNPFVITSFTNPSGDVVFRVAGRIDGLRIRKNFATRAEAKAELEVLKIKRVEAQTGIRVAATRLNEAELKEAENAFGRVAGRTRSLTFYLEFGLANYRDPVQDKPIAEAAREYLALREADHKRGDLSHRQFTSFRCELRALEITFRGKMVSDLSAPMLTEFFRRGQVSKKSFNNRRGLIGVFLKHCMVVNDWIAVNPIDRVPHFRGIGHRRGSAPTLSAQKCAEIMQWAQENHGGALVPFTALCLFAGIRPDLYEGEISKLEPAHVRLDTGVILIEPEVSKVRMKRAITIQPNLAAWLKAYPLERFPIMPRGFRRLRLEFRKRFELSHDILRHTFISMFVGKFRSMGDAALQAGNSEAIIRKHYLDLKSKDEANEFFNIVPRAWELPLPKPVASPIQEQHKKPGNAAA